MIRSIKKEDSQALAVLNKDLGHPVSLEIIEQQLEKCLAKGDLILVAETDGQVIGYVHGSSYDTLYFSPLLNVLGLVVLNSYRGQGWGRKLMESLKERADREGYAHLRINSGIGRKEAHQFYRSLGCEDEVEQKRFLW